MNIEAPDVHQTLEYRTDTAILKGVPSALVLCLLGLVAFALIDDPPAEIAVAGFVLVSAGVGWTAFALWRRSHPGRPLYVLSPPGIRYRVPWVKEILIPWREIEGIDTIEITAWTWSRYPRQVTFRDVAVVLVSKQFYDRHIFVDSAFMRGPGWSNTFVEKGTSVQVALHHELVSVEPQALREAIAARWRAFRTEPTGPAPLGAHDGQSVAPRNRHVPVVRRTIGDGDAAARPDPTPAPGIPAPEVRPRMGLAWEAAKIVVPLIGIAVVLANLLGVWATAGQTAAREETRKWEEADRQREEERRQAQEQAEQARRRLQEFWQRNR